MKIEQYKPINKGTLKAVFTLVTNEGLKIRGMKVIDGMNGLFVGSPSEKREVNGEAKYFDTVFIPNGKDGDPNVQDKLQDLVNQNSDPVGDDDLPY